MSWLFSQVLVEEYLGDICSDGELSVPLNGNSTQQAYLSQDKMTKFSRLSRFGMTYKPLTESLGEELLTLYLEDFHAKTLVQPEKVLESQEQEAQCGDTWHGLLAKLDPNTHLWKIPQCSLLEDSEQSLETWPNWGTMRNGVCWEQMTWEQTITENEYGLSERIPNNLDFFHTPCTTGLDGGSNSRKALKKRMEKMPTPLSSDYKGVQRMRDNHQNDLAAVVGGPVNPTFSEWLMGWLLGWTDLKPLEMDKFHCVPQQLGTSLKEE
jgi:hypothetical protein